MYENIERCILSLVKRSTPDSTAWNMEKIRQGKKTDWNYIDGCMLGALCALSEITGDDRYAAFVEQVGDAFVNEDGSIRTFDAEKRRLDDYNEGRILFPLIRRTGKEKYRRAAEMLHAELMKQPRIPEGNFWHKEIYPNQVWLDGTYMALPFEAMYRKELGDGDFTDVCSQIRSVREHMRDEKTGLYYHGWDATRKAFWADPETGLSRSFWLRAFGWFVLALSELCEILPEGGELREMQDTLREALEAAGRFADPETGMYWQVMDQPGREGNYLETSGSCMIACAMLRAARLGIAGEETGHLGRKTFDSIVRDRLKCTENEMGIGGICLVAGLGPESDRRRDGTYAYYISEPVVENDAKGVAPFVLCYTEIRRLMNP